MKTPRSFAAAAARSPDAIILTDPRGRVEWINPAFTRLCGYTLRDMKGRKPGALLQGEATDPAATARLRSAISHRRPATVELINYHKNGRPYAVSISLHPLRDRAGKVTGYLAIERETTAHQVAIRRLEDEIAQLYAIICHLTAGQTQAA